MLLSLLRGYANATPGYRRGIPSGEYVQVWKISLLGGAQRTHADLAQHSAHHSQVHRDTCTNHPTPAASSTHEAQIYIMRASYPGGVVAVITGGCGAYPRMGAAYA